MNTNNKSPLKIALVGNPNCGKTTLFNHLTKSQARVGNFPGVTVEKREGICHTNSGELIIVDLPGIYSLSPYSAEEIISRDFLLEGGIDGIINILDATSLERSLYLTSQLAELGIPMIVALNMMDEAQRLEIKIDTEKLSNLTQLKFVPITASKGTGIKDLLNFADYLSPKAFLTDTTAMSLINEVKTLASRDNILISLFDAIKLIEKDRLIYNTLPLSASTKEKIRSHIEESESKLNLDWEMEIINLRYSYIEFLVRECVTKGKRKEKLTLSDRLDLILTDKFLALPLFALIMAFIFTLTFGKVGAFLSDSFDFFINDLTIPLLDTTLKSLGASPWLIDLIINGIASGVGMVLVFLPQILLLFACLSFLEDCGYMSRIAFIMDRALTPFGLCGKSLVPLLMGFGCSVPAIMATRTLQSERTRRLTILLAPFMSCGARMSVFVFFASGFFPKHQGLIVTSLYLIGIFIALLSAIILKPDFSADESFIIELPPYRLPSLNTTLTHSLQKAKDFIQKTFTTLLLFSIIIYLLQSYTLDLTPAATNAESIFSHTGRLLAPLFSPCGFGDWRAVSALLSGLVAKEAIISTLSIVYGDSLLSAFTPLSAYSYLIFVQLYLPCIATLSAIKKETHSLLLTLFALAYQCSVAYLTSMLFYQIASRI